MSLPTRLVLAEAARKALREEIEPMNPGQFLHVPRSATVMHDNGERESRPLESWRDLEAFVLLGDPGAGKSVSFEGEAAACGGVYITARDFRTGIFPPDMDGKTIFIDGLDEVCAGQSDRKSPFDDIRARLNTLGRPRFRLSCREADWLGASDKSNLAKVAPAGSLEVLHLDPLSRKDIFAVLRSRPKEVSDPDDFWEHAERFNLTAMFGNPLLLDLTIKASSQGWPSTRREIYEAACRQLAIEISPGHREARPLGHGDIEKLLDDAGLLCAILLLSNQAAWTQQLDEPSGTIHLKDIPDALHLHDPRAALASKIFTTVAGQAVPRHRSIAEFLAAKALASKIRDGLPLNRVLGLMQGFDGHPVEPLRGLFAWLAVHHPADREQLIRLDPLGVVLNGDVASFSTSEKIAVLDALKDLAQRDPWFRQNSWVSHPFGPLATADMESEYLELLLQPSRTNSHQVLIDCALDALSHGAAMSSLIEALETWITDEKAWIGIRETAFNVWKRAGGFTPEKTLSWLHGVFNNSLVDDGDRLLDTLLVELYPKYIGPTEIFKFFRATRQPSNVIPKYPNFWSYQLLDNSSPEHFEQLIDAWIATRSTTEDKLPTAYELRSTTSHLLALALKHAGDRITDSKLYTWLGLCTDSAGFTTLEQEYQHEVNAWLEARPLRMKGIVSIGFIECLKDRNSSNHFWEAEERLLRARRPKDWLWWLLECASHAEHEKIAEYCFFQVADNAIRPEADANNPNMDDIASWVERHTQKWPMTQQWLENTWSSPLDHYKARQFQRKKAEEAKNLEIRMQREKSMRPIWQNLIDCTASAYDEHQITQVIEQRFVNIRGETPVERVQDYLACDEATAVAAIAGIEKVLDRSDLPSADEILEADSKGNHDDPISTAALYAAKSICNTTPTAALDWPQETIESLVAFFITKNRHKTVNWFTLLLKQQPEIIAPILIKYTFNFLHKRCEKVIHSIYLLPKEEIYTKLALLILPDLLRNFPCRSNEYNRHILNTCLLPAIYKLNEDCAKEIIRHSIENIDRDASQKVSWLVAAAPIIPDAASQIKKLIEDNALSVALLVQAIREQDLIKKVGHRLSPSTIAELIELIAPQSSYYSDANVDTSAARNHRNDEIDGLIYLLSSNTGIEARKQLASLANLFKTEYWKNKLSYAIHAQITTAREKNFHSASPADAAFVIANQSPASAIDLQALALHQLGTIEASLRGSNTFLLNQFWTDKENPTPHSENHCRDIIQERLREKLQPLNIYIEREGSAADDKRADMRLNFLQRGNRLAVPIEVKKDNHRKLWTAWEEQLERLYTIDPDAGGVGIYLVLWFNHEGKTSPEGVNHQSAAQLQKMLTERIPLEKRCLLKVKVMDLSRP